jgi:hypothetical protein
MLIERRHRWNAREAREVGAMTSKHYRQGRTVVGVGNTHWETGYWAQSREARAIARHPIARWRHAVAAVFEPLVLVIIPLLLWGLIGGAATPLIVAIGLSVALVILTGGTLLASALASDVGAWRPRDAR